MREIVVLSGAEADLFSAYCWFEALDPALADRCDAAVNRVLLRLAEFPEIGAPFRSKYRGLLVEDFAHGFFYRADHSSRITVIAILDLRQDPALISRRLGGE